MKNKVTQEKIIYIAFWILTAAYGVLCLYLFYNQSVQPADYKNTYFEADLPYHISMVRDDGWYYSLTGLMYLLLLKIGGGSTVPIAVFLALVAVATVIMTERLLKKIWDVESGLACAGALALNFVMPFYIRWAGEHRYISYQSGNIWHNSTYQVMKLGALICLYLYFVYEKKYYVTGKPGENSENGKNSKNGEKSETRENGEKCAEGLKLREYIIFAAGLALTTFIKPSFLTVFAPAFAIKLLRDIAKGKAKFIKALLFGITVLPSVGVMFWQNSILFGEETENGYGFAFFKTFSLHADHPKVTVILSLAFPIAVAISLIVNALWSKIKTGKVPEIDRDYSFSILVAVIGFILAAVLDETGERAGAGNFLWGYSIALAFLYTTSFIQWIGFIKKKRYADFAVCGAIFAYQMVCGIIFFTRLLGGETYFMK